MDFSYTDEQELLIDNIKEFCERYCPNDKIDEMYKNEGMSDELIKAYLDAGFGMMGIPEKYDGIDCDTVTLGILTEAFAHYSGAVTPLFENTLAMRDMLEFGNEKQIKMCMDEYSKSGKPIFSLGFSEPGAGSDNMNMSTVTVKQPDGTYILNGQKTWITQGDKFPYILLVAKDEDPSRSNRNMSLWLVPLSADGVTTSPLHKIGQQIQPFVEMFFKDVKLTEDMRVGEKGKGFYNLMKNFELERSLLAAQAVGIAQAAMDDAGAYVSQRITFEKPLYKHEMIQEKLTDMEIRIQNMRTMMYRTMWMIDNNQSVRLQSAMLKRYCSMECVKVCSDALQIYGGLGYTTETRLGRLFCDARGFEISAGTNEIMAYICGRQIAKKYQKK